jgi:hypothetical protein
LRAAENRPSIAEAMGQISTKKVMAKAPALRQVYAAPSYQQPRPVVRRNAGKRLIGSSNHEKGL